MLQAVIVVALGLSATARAGFPDGPNQQCTDDAGPPWMDDGKVAYYVGFPNKPVLPATGQCPPPLSSACAAKGALAAHLDGPVDCAGKGWFCRIFDQPGHRMPGVKDGAFPDSNFASCNQSDTEHDRDGHCHGSDVDDTYGWWVRDHWHRNYAGRLKCCCDWRATIGVVNRCDYRKHVAPKALESCRDANEEHNVDWHPNCRPEHFTNYKEPPAATCWEVSSFGPGPGDDAPTTTAERGPPPAPTATTTPRSDGGSSWGAVDGGVGRVCRGSGGGDNSPGYYRLYHGVGALSDCKAKCEETPGCRGVEHSLAGRCEVWTRAEGIGSSKAMSGYSCFRYGSTPPPAPGPHRDFVPVDGGEDRACRGEHRADNSVGYYTVHSGVDELEDCEAECADTAGCQGIEYNEDRGRCEVWTRPRGIEASAPAPGFLCLRYGSSALLETPGVGAARHAPGIRRHSFRGNALLQTEASRTHGPAGATVGEEL